MKKHFLIGLALILLTLVVYSKAVNHDFVNYDDPQYVTKNSHVQEGLSLDNILWAFTSFEASNWHPLTWISHMADYQLFGLDARGHHLTNILFHLINTVLLFVLFSRMTGAIWRSGFVAALFAIHPLHVESVAWIAERKDVLSALFFLLTLLAYTRYVKRPCLARYLGVVLLFCLGLMAKPMLVTLPLVLLLIDFWPLGRFFGNKGSEEESGTLTVTTAQVGLLVMEKIPLLLLSLASCIVTILAQSSGGTVSTVVKIPVSFRLLNACIAYADYIRDLFWPANLAVLYPLPDQINLMHGLGAVLLLLAVSAMVVRKMISAQYLIVGWLWFLATLIPVIGFVQVGIQARADRYTYIPYIGLFIMLAWGVPELLRGWRYRRVVLGAFAVASILTLSLITWQQIDYWKDSVTLFSQALRVTQNNYMAHHELGLALLKTGNIDEAIVHFRKAIGIDPDWLTGQIDLGNALVAKGNAEAAIVPFSAAVRIDPDNADTHYSLGMAFGRAGQMEAAERSFSQAVSINPSFANGYYGLGVVWAKQGKFDMAASYFTKALKLRPEFPEASKALERISELKAQQAQSAESPVPAPPASSTP